MIADVEPEQVLVVEAPTSPTDVVNDETLIPIEPKPKAKRTGQSKKKQSVETIEAPTLEEVPVIEVEEEFRQPQMSRLKKL